MSKYFLWLILLSWIALGPLEYFATKEAHRILLAQEKSLLYLNKLYSNKVKYIRITWKQECLKKKDAVPASYISTDRIFFGEELMYIITNEDGGGIKVPTDCVEIIEPAEIKET